MAYVKGVPTYYLPGLQRVLQVGKRRYAHEVSWHGSGGIGDTLWTAASVDFESPQGIPHTSTVVVFLPIYLPLVLRRCVVVQGRGFSCRVASLGTP